MREESSKTQKRYHFLDGARALAVLLIVMHHSVTSFFSQLLVQGGFPRLASFLGDFTQSGVELFFVLSGVVLLRPYLRYDRKMDLVTYARRRFLRIYPPYFAAVLFGATVIFINSHFPTWYSSILVGFSLHSFLKQFLIFNQNWDYYNLAWWSLQLEIVFYLFVPLILKALRACNGRVSFLFHGFVALLVSVGLQGLIAHLFPDKYSTTIVYVNLYRFVDYIPCFYLGVCLAKWDFTKHDRIVALVFSFLLLLMSNWYWPFVHMSFAFLYFALLSALFAGVRLQILFSRGSMVWLGERSYSLFLTHFSVFYLVNYVVSNLVGSRDLLYGVLTRGVGLPLSVVVASVLFWYVEKPFAKGLATADYFWPIAFSRSSLLRSGYDSVN